tara:strand:- start:27 stop:236 length:210 start_codon:yes stop_codon:yes gene_type:complete
MKTNINNATDELVETYILHNGYEFKYGEFYECPGGHIWHWSDLVDTIENMSAPEFYNLCFLAEQDKENA